MCRSIIHNEQSRKTVVPLGLTLFVQILLMNAMDMLPVDLLPMAWQGIIGNHHALLRVVPTADLNTTLALAIGVLLICIYYNVKTEDLGGWIHESSCAPFGPWLAPANFLLNLVEFLSKTISHGMRLFGNMYVGELVFLLITLLGGVWASTGSVETLDLILFVFHLTVDLAWTIFHILVITLQAFILMALASVYIGQAYDAH